MARIQYKLNIKSKGGNVHGKERFKPCQNLPPLKENAMYCYLMIPGIGANAGLQGRTALFTNFAWK